MISPESKARVTWQIRQYADALLVAIDNGDDRAALAATYQLRATCDGLGRELTVAEFDLNGACRRHKQLQAELAEVRRQWRHSAGAPGFRAGLEREQVRITGELRKLDSASRQAVQA